MKNEAKDIISTGIEKASGGTGINIEVRDNSSKNQRQFQNASTNPLFRTFNPPFIIIEMTYCVANCYIVCLQVR